MVKKNDFSTLSNWTQNATLTRKGSNVLEKTSKIGHFDRQTVKNFIQKMADALNAEGRDGRIGVALHYKNSNDWAGGEMTHVNMPVSVYDPTDSPDGHIVDGDSIDRIQIYLIKNKELPKNIFKK